MRFEGTKAKEDFEKAFGKPISEFTVEQLWVLTKYAKHCRLRCRNNVAFNRHAEGIFGPKFQYKTVNKTRISRVTGREETYPGLSIVDKVSNKEVSEDEGEE